MTLTQEKRVPLSWAARWRRIRLHAIPIACFVMAVAACGWLWHPQRETLRSIGEVDVLRVNVTSPVAGLIVALPHETNGQWDLYDHVQAGEILARMDDRQLRSDQGLFRQEIKELVDELNLWKATSVEHAAPDTVPGIELAWQHELGQLTLLLQSSLGMPAPEQTTEMDPTAATPPELPATVPGAVKAGLSRLRQARETLEMRRDDLELRTESLEIRAPISGTLVAVNCWPGQAVPQGGRVATIAADHGQHIVSYLPEDSRLEPQPGMRVVLRPRAHAAGHLTSEVEQVGHQIQRIPDRYLPKSSSSRWGIPVRIKMPSDASLRPGSVVDVEFSTAG
jgi:multidrug resistance efflux pump